MKPPPCQIRVNEFERLRTVLLGYGRLAMAYSGGVDSSTLAKFAAETLGAENILLVFADICFVKNAERSFAKQWAAENGWPLKIVGIDILKDKAVAVNVSDRCYHCKLKIMGEMKELARRQGFDIFADGTNTDDLDDFRPGLRAAAELGVRHPFVEAGCGKARVRLLGRRLGLPHWNRPASACLATRISIGTELSLSSLRLADSAEASLERLGFAGCRIRMNDETAKVELNPIHFGRFERRRTEIADALLALGLRLAADSPVVYESGGGSAENKHPPGGGASPPVVS